MTYDHLYKPEPCSAWPVHELRAVGGAYREAGGRGLDGAACLDAAVAAYLAAGGGQHGAERAVRDMIASLSREQGDWLWGPAQAWRDRHAPAAPEPAWAETEDAQ
ncbi:hypothetical protein [Muricoccus vinaceus]|uniref:Uncharacterized protein n=1 Tax=Muricoccus vinaceus TaxID=424704 RepID=A0ABV6IL07_9PROT